MGDMQMGTDMGADVHVCAHTRTRTPCEHTQRTLTATLQGEIYMESESHSR